MVYSITATCERCGKKTDAPITSTSDSEKITADKPYTTVVCGTKSGEICKTCYIEFLSALEQASSNYKTLYKACLDKFNAAKAAAQSQHDTELNAFWGGTGNEITRR